MTFLDQSDRTTAAAARLFAEQEAGTVVGEDAGMLMVASARPYPLAFRHEDSAGLFWVATKTSARKRGLGALVSAAAVEGAFRAGAKSATLTATALGAPVYRRLGFERFSGRARYSF